MSPQEFQVAMSQEKEGPLYNQDDFIGSSFSVLDKRYFDIYQDRVTLLIPVGRGENAKNLDASIFLFEDIKDVIIKKSLFGFSYKVLLRLYQKKYFNGTPFLSDTILLASGLSKENTDSLQSVLQNVRDRVSIKATGHPYTESLEYQSIQLQKRGEEVNAAIEKSALPVMKMITLISFGFLLLLIGITVMVIHSPK